MAKKLAIFGISGRTGCEIARVSMSRGWEVCGLVRPKSKLPADILEAKIIRGEFSERNRVVETIANCDAVCCVIGPRPPYSDTFCANATIAIISAMQQTGSRRLICQSGAMIGSAPNRSYAMEWMARSFARRQPEVARDREEQERLIIAGNMDWTIVKPPRLANTRPQGKVEASPTLRVGILSKISRTDLAAFILDVLEQNRFIQQRVFVKG
jgi:putative NADH-flavin reductase